MKMRERVTAALPAVGAAGAMAVCCTVHLAAAGAFAALGGWLISPWLVVAGLALLAVAGATLIQRRRRGHHSDNCCPPQAHQPRPTERPTARQDQYL